MAALLKQWDIRNWIVALAAMGVLGLCLSPLLALSLAVVGEASVGVVLNGSAWWLFFRSFVFHGAVAFTAAGLGALLAYPLMRWNLPFRQVLFVVLSLPVFIPSYVHALSWSHLLGEKGLIHTVMLAVFSTAGLTDWLIKWFEAGWVLVTSYYPVAFVVACAALARWDMRYHEAALLHAGPWRALYLQWRYMRFHLAVAALLIFLLSFSDFSVPDLFQVHVYATEVFIRLSAYLDTRAAVVTSLLPVGATLLLLWVVVRMSDRISLGSGDGRIRRAQLKPLGAWRYPVFVGFGALAFWLVLLPLVNLVQLADNWTNMWRALSMAWSDTLISAAIAIGTVAISGMLGLLASYGYARGLRPAGHWLRVVSLMAFIAPASLIGLGSIYFWNREGWFGWVYESGFVLVLALGARWLPVMFEVLTASWRQLPRSQESVAYTFGMSWFTTFRRISLPQIGSGLRVAALIGFVFAFNDIALTVLLAPPGLSTLPLRIFSTVHYGPDSMLAALSLWQVMFLTVPVAGLFWYGRDYFKGQREFAEC